MATKNSEIPPTEAEAAITPPEANGVKPGPQMTRRERWVSLPDDYSEFKFRFWLNHPTGLIEQVKYGIGDEQKEALSKIVLEHNDWRDTDGNPYPPASDPTFWDQIPDEVLGAIISTINLAKQELSNLVTTTRRR